MSVETLADVDVTTREFVLAYNELPLWSAPFGLALLDRVVFRDGMQILDVGCGSGFPLIEVVQRCGSTARAWGVDPWEEAVRMARERVAVMGLQNVQLVACSAEDLPFEDAFFDLIVSNNGLNNVPDQQRALEECARTARAGSQLLCTMNLPETMQTFYAVFKLTLRQRGLGSLHEALRDHIREKRKSLDEHRRLLFGAGWLILHEDHGSFTMRFADGSAMLRHYFIRAAFLGSWLAIVPAEQRQSVFDALEQNLNKRARREGCLPMEVPFVCFDCRKSG